MSAGNETKVRPSSVIDVGTFSSPDGSCPSWCTLTRTQTTETGHRKHLKVSEKLEGRREDKIVPDAI